MLDTQKRDISAQGLPLSLTRKEFGILEYLMLRAGQAVSQEELLEHISGGRIQPFQPRSADAHLFPAEKTAHCPGI